MNIIVAVDKNWAIGYQNKLLNSIPEDMKFFRETTTGKVVVMGRKTLESFPNGRRTPSSGFCSQNSAADHMADESENQRPAGYGGQSCFAGQRQSSYSLQK